jgi:hypothetical protein
MLCVCIVMYLKQMLPYYTRAGFDLTTHSTSLPRWQAETIPLDHAVSAYTHTYLHTQNVPSLIFFLLKVIHVYHSRKE